MYKPVIVIIDDESQIRKNSTYHSGVKWYKVIEADNAKNGLVQRQTSHANLILLDWIAWYGWLEVLKEIRSFSDVPVIILSVRNSEEDIVAALDLGADDYLTKPFNTSELLARIRASLRRTQQPQESVFKNGGLSIDFASHVVTKDLEELKLTNTEYELLLLFIKNIGKVLTHRFILKEIWGPSYIEHSHICAYL